MEYNSSDTNFFIEMRDDLEREIITLTNIISKKKEQLEFITKIVNEKCDHEWLNDSIDKSPENYEGISIKYCKKCLLTYNTM